MGTFYPQISFFPSSIVKNGQKNTNLWGFSCFQVFSLLSSFCFFFSALVFLLSLCFSTSWSLKRYPPVGVSGYMGAYIHTRTAESHLEKAVREYLSKPSRLWYIYIHIWSRQEKAHKHKLFCPVGPSFHRTCPMDKPSLSLEIRWKTGTDPGILLILHSGSPISPGLSPGTIPGTKGGTESLCEKSLCAFFSLASEEQCSGQCRQPSFDVAGLDVPAPEILRAQVPLP